MLFSDIKLKIEFLVCSKSSKSIPFNKIDFDKFKLKFLNKFFFNSGVKSFLFSNTASNVSLKLLDVRGEIFLKKFHKVWIAQ